MTNSCVDCKGLVNMSASEITKKLDMSKFCSYQTLSIHCVFPRFNSQLMCTEVCLHLILPNQQESRSRQAPKIKNKTQKSERLGNGGPC
jgi:hypothetical protein